MKPVNKMNKQELVEEFNKIPCRVSILFASRRSGGKRVAWWYEQWVRFPDYTEMPQIYERKKKFRNVTQALRYALVSTKEAMHVRWKNNSP